MPKSLIQITQFIGPIYMLLVTRVQAEQNQCQCSCTIPHYRRTDVCKWISSASPKVDSNQNELTHLQRDILDLKKNNDYFKNKIDKKILPFIEAAEQSDEKPVRGNSPDVRTESTAPNQENVNAASIKELVEKIQSLTKQLKDDKERLEVKIEMVENIILKTKDEVTAKVNDAENRALKAEADLLTNINGAKMEFLNARGELFERVNAVDNRTLKMKDEFTVKVNETANRTSEIKEEVLEKVNQIEDRSLKGRDELLREVKQVEDALRKGLESERLDRNHLEETLNKTRDRLGAIAVTQEETALALRGEISSSAEIVKADILDNYLKDISRKMDVLENENYRNLDGRLGTLEAKLENYKDLGINVTSLENRYKNLYTRVSRMRSVIQTNLLPGVRGLEEKTSQLEEVVKSSLGNFSSNITAVWSSIQNIESNEQQMFNNIIESVTLLQNKIDEIAKRPSDGAEKSKTTCETNQKQFFTVNSSPYHSYGPDEKCGAVDLPNINSINGSMLTHLESKELRKFLLTVQRSPKNQTQYRNHCVAVRVGKNRAITSDECFKERELYNYRASEGTGDHTEQIRWISSFGNQDMSRQSGMILINIPETLSQNHDDFMCSPSEQMRDKVLGEAIFLGWDDLENQADPLSKLQLHDVCFITDEACGRAYPLWFNPTMICTKADQRVQRSCEISKGGLLVKVVGNKAVLTGIVRNCGLPGKPVMYTEVSYFMYDINFTRWIRISNDQVY